MRKTEIILLFLFSLAIIYGQDKTNFISNPIISGYYAEPAIIKYNNAFYIYATKDPWGGKELGVLVTKDFLNWEVKHINWPTKKACTSSTSFFP